ncbi:hypothetical protein [Actinomadura sp. NEAU-AAG7]|uniref:hypothetical protein n=1 Tax=Actinomadura sp. NEAU-AAG7 TaxID=2839640 RepID=UPI001BE4AD50|nr:hypothetical protein [Actinomadura sp. NEAU-AAG7]MBT2212438.1 hypothetical protein [Actinomadura sp. NEAU-AAG7]
MLTIPYIFTQDDLLTADGFLKKAKERGHKLTLDDLQMFHSHRLLLPLYRVSDTPVVGHKIAVEPDGGMNARGWTIDAAADGRLRDPAEEGYSAAWPYRRPRNEDFDHWWNGFVYSPWQLFHIDAAVSEFQFIRDGWHPPVHNNRYWRQCRRLTLVLAALATRYLPAILGRLSMPNMAGDAGLRAYRATVDVQALLKLVGFSPTELSGTADTLLMQAGSEPLAKWLPLLRYARYKGWSKLRGEPLDAMWQRVAAEILLRAHEDLAADGVLEPLPDLSGSGWHAPQHDRLTPRHAEAQTLERALAEFGLSPHPKVILLVEGETEFDHVPKLLTEFGITQPQQVRVQRTKSSKVNVHLIARYGVTPRVGRKFGDGWLLDASPTALMIAMDAENDFETEFKRDKLRRKLQEAIREEVQYQDADISQVELDHLVHVQVWGEDKYELANFTDDELVPAITILAISQQNQRVSSATWEQDLRTELQAARAAHADIKVPMGRMRVREQKTKLAEILWPVLLAKCEAEYVADRIETPVLNLVVEVRKLVAQMTGVFALKGP